MDNTKGNLNQLKSHNLASADRIAVCRFIRVALARVVPAFTVPLASFLTFLPIWVMLPENSISRRFYCLICGVLATSCVLFATALWLIKKLPSHTPALAEEAGISSQLTHWAGAFLARLRKAIDPKLRQWHNGIGACSLPFAVVHASFRLGGWVTLTLMLLVVAVIASGVLLAYQKDLIVLKGLGAKGTAATKDAAELLDSSRRRNLQLHRAGTFVLLAALVLHVVFSMIF